MQRYTYCFFDLDGTVIDSSLGITNSVRYALNRMQAPTPSVPLTAFIGPPLTVGFSEYCGMNEKEALLAVEYYRENYRAGGIFECTVYDGIRELLEELRKRGTVCALATCKPREFAVRILDHLELSPYFSAVAGPDFKGTRENKSEVIEDAMKALGIQDPTSVLMIGDRASDVLGARNVGMDCIGAVWGVGEEEELSPASPLAIHKVPSDILQYF